MPTLVNILAPCLLSSSIKPNIVQYPKHCQHQPEIFHSGWKAESIQWFTKNQASSPSYDLALLSQHLPTPVSNLSLFLSPSVCRRRIYWRKRGRGGGGAKSYNGEKAWPSLKHSLLLDVRYTKGVFKIFVLHFIQNRFICRSSDSTVSVDAGIEPRTVATLTFVVTL